MRQQRAQQVLGVRSSRSSTSTWAKYSREKVSSGTPSARGWRASARASTAAMRSSRWFSVTAAMLCSPVSAL
ncbi:hypothetical protein [Ramlibacter montanisoli]|uniref:Uncharacterized protein n=1 Tax=Ramlibacter montanisoli TaxID=2732512 RepID=A0A849K8V6_9BURK|nr:hypothetical protein [Ramlibacter montanisoli]NNU44812.1 hypothetical protein [Ramlibacter montanisoli]